MRNRKEAFTGAELPLSLRWRPHDSAMSAIRVWRNTWSGDQFEILNIAMFNQLSAFCKTFNIPLLDYTDED